MRKVYFFTDANGSLFTLHLYIILKMFVDNVLRYDLHSEILDNMGNHDDIATCVEYSDQSCELSTVLMLLVLALLVTLLYN